MCHVKHETIVLHIIPASKNNVEAFATTSPDSRFTRQSVALVHDWSNIPEVVTEVQLSRTATRHGRLLYYTAAVIAHGLQYYFGHGAQLLLSGTEALFNTWKYFRDEKARDEP